MQDRHGKKIVLNIYKKKKLKDAKEKGVLKDIKRGKSPYHTVAKGGYIKKYSRGGGVLRKAK